MTLLEDFKKFVTDTQNEAYYKKWIHDSPILASKWYSFRDAILAGQRPTPPDMGNNFYGKSLVDTGLIYLNATAPPPYKINMTISGTAQVGNKLLAGISVS